MKKLSLHNYEWPWLPGLAAFLLVVSFASRFLLIDDPLEENQPEAKPVAANTKPPEAKPSPPKPPRPQQPAITVQAPLEQSVLPEDSNQSVKLESLATVVDTFEETYDKYKMHCPDPQVGSHEEAELEIPPSTEKIIKDQIERQVVCPGFAKDSFDTFVITERYCYSSLNGGPNNWMTAVIGSLEYDCWNAISIKEKVFNYFLSENENILDGARARLYKGVSPSSNQRKFNKIICRQLREFNEPTEELVLTNFTEGAPESWTSWQAEIADDQNFCDTFYPPDQNSPSPP